MDLILLFAVYSICFGLFGFITANKVGLVGLGIVLIINIFGYVIKNEK